MKWVSHDVFSSESRQEVNNNLILDILSMMNASLHGRLVSLMLLSFLFFSVLWATGWSLPYLPVGQCAVTVSRCAPGPDSSARKNWGELCVSSDSLQFPPCAAVRAKRRACGQGECTNSFQLFFREDPTAALSGRGRMRQLTPKLKKYILSTF